MRARLLRVPTALVVTSLALAACGPQSEGDPQLTVYVSVPRSGPDATTGRDVSDGARLALEDAGGEAGGVAVAARYLDNAGGAGGPAQTSVAAAARTATEDSTAIAYIGEIDSAATQVSVPITNEAGLLQVSPGPVADELVRERAGGNDVPTGFQTSGSRTLGALLAATDPGTATPLVPQQLPEEGRRMLQRFQRRFHRPPGPWVAYGYEAMAVALDSIDRSADPLNRGAVVDAYLATADRDSVLGTYSVDPVGVASNG